VWLEDVDAFADKVPEAGDCSLADLSEHGFETREGLLDWIEVGAVWRQEAECCTGRFDPLGIPNLIPNCAKADSDLGFPNGKKSDSMVSLAWRTRYGSID